MLPLIITLLTIALSALGAIFALPTATPRVMPRKGIDETGWTCGSCGATNSDIVHSYCQFCGQ